MIYKYRGEINAHQVNGMDWICLSWKCVDLKLCKLYKDKGAERRCLEEVLNPVCLSCHTHSWCWLSQQTSVPSVIRKLTAAKRQQNQFISQNELIFLFLFSDLLWSSFQHHCHHLVTQNIELQYSVTTSYINIRINSKLQEFILVAFVFSLCLLLSIKCCPY